MTDTLDNNDLPIIPEHSRGATPDEIRPISIADEMKRSYLDYAMSVIVSRALPDVRDGLKPVHRRILFSMHEQGFEHNKPYRKSARIVGDVIGKYHPHGDQSVYDALVRMAQPFSMSTPLIDGQGNFGSVDADPPAAMRYTESRLQKISAQLLDNLEENTVDYQENYDNSEKEPVVLPAKFPNMLVNGGGGIAVGMATNIPPHNLGEVIDATIALIDNPLMLAEDLLEYVPGPDFPTNANILGRSGIRSAYLTGRGSIVMRSKHTMEKFGKDRDAIVFTEIPYQVNKAAMVEKIAELIRDKKIEGISDMRDESNRLGIRVVMELKRDAVADVVLNQLYRFTQLQTSFSANMVALNGGRPMLMNLHDILSSFVSFREEVVTRRTRYRLNKSRERAHILCGLAIAVANIDEIIRIIRTAPDPATARENLMNRSWNAREIESLIRLVDDPRHPIKDDGTYVLSEIQARAILELRLARLTALGRDEIGDELKSIAENIMDFLDILRSRTRVMDIIKGELSEIKANFAVPRRSEILEVEGDFDDEDLIQREEMVVTVSHEGYVKRVPLNTYRAQRRGGKGRGGMATKDEDFVANLFVASTHTPILCFSNLGIVYKMKVWRLPIATPQGRGKAFVNILPLKEGERITNVMPLPEDETTWANLDVMFATSKGTTRRNSLADFGQVNRGGKIAMKIEEGESIVGVAICTDEHDVLLTSAQGQCIRFAVSDVRVFQSRASMGVRGINLADGDKLIAMSILNHVEATSEERAGYFKMKRAVTGEEETGVEEGTLEGSISPERYTEMSAKEEVVLTISENGYGKRTSSYEYRITGRGGKGIVAMQVTERNGSLVASFPVVESDQIMLVTNGGQLIRCPVNGIRVAGRSTSGVTVFKTAADEKVVSVERVGESEGDEGEE